MLDFSCVNVGFWLCGRCILIVMKLGLDCWMLDFGCMDVGFLQVDVRLRLFGRRILVM